MPDPDIRSIDVKGIGREEFRRGTVGFHLLGLAEQGEDARRELQARELHHFEAERAMTEALAVLDSHVPGEVDYLERIFRAQNILRAALSSDHTDGSAT